MNSVRQAAIHTLTYTLGVSAEILEISHTDKINRLERYLLNSGIPIYLCVEDIKHALQEKVERDVTDAEVDQFVKDHYVANWGAAMDEMKDTLDYVVSEEYAPDDPEGDEADAHEEDGL